MRKERGITVYEMATRLGVSRNTLTNWERGEKEPHAVEMLEEMAKILKVSLKEILIDEDKMPTENNFAIKNLQERVTKIEKFLKDFMK
ncbi:MAG: helix-turn-helix transcriptional regulator [Selenomonadaceae bacterium]|nr:helix-turn-helix transcriptional regulator [Selenomonadaceae bacterium]